LTKCFVARRARKRSTHPRALHYIHHVSSTPDNGSPIQRDYSCDAPVLFIVFSGLRRAPKEKPGFSFINVTGTLRAKKLFVRDLTKAWYLRGLPGLAKSVDETTEFFRKEIASTGAQRVVLTGYSLGGFAAMLYGTLLNSDEVHAFSPQTFVSMRQRIRHGDHRWNRYALKLPLTTPARFRDLRPILLESQAKTRHEIYYAEDSRLDVLHAQHVTGLRNVTLHPHAEGRHRLVTALRDTGELLRIFERAVAA
jgi:hypothetical protein